MNPTQLPAKPALTSMRVRVPFVARRLATGILLGGAMIASPAAFAVKGPAESVVGQVTLLIGKAYVVHESGKVQPVSKGMDIHEHDKIETTSSGFVHIRFVDDALMTVRPRSALEIQAYQYDPNDPSNSTVKLELLEGVARAISGEAAQKAKHNFRMNTPIAAIGVRGTDFIVGADDTTMRAVVKQGIIVAAPFSALCSAESYGPCTEGGVELTGDSNQLLQISAVNSEVSTVLLARDGSQTEQAIAEAVLPSSSEEEDNSTEVYTETVSMLAVSDRLSSPPDIGNPGNEDPVVIPEYTPDVPEAPLALVSNTQLVWGRYYENDSSLERITTRVRTPEEINSSLQMSAAASAASDALFADGGGREVTTGNNLYALYRVENGSKSVKPGLGVVGFELSKAQAHYTAAGSNKELMDVLGGNLEIDFTRSTFETDLMLSHAATGKVTFTASGQIFPGGYFHSRTAGQSMAGAVSLDGTEAGYLFDKSLDTGSITGLTLWGQEGK